MLTDSVLVPGQVDTKSIVAGNARLLPLNSQREPGQLGVRGARGAVQFLFV